jgi:hypothetical protein
MANIPALHKTNTRNYSSINGGYPARSYLFTFGATFAGVAFGVLMSLGMMRPILQDQVASATKGLSQQIVAARPASSFTSCAMPTASSGQGGELLGAQTVKAGSSPTTTKPGGGKGSGGSEGNNGGNKTVFVHKLVSGIYATTTGTNSTTGPGSTNVVKSTNTNTTKVENHNDVTLTNNNRQTATSGDVTSQANTNAGQASSGDARNTSQATFDVNITN